MCQCNWKDITFTRCMYECYCCMWHEC